MCDKNRLQTANNTCSDYGLDATLCRIEHYQRGINVTNTDGQTHHISNNFLRCLEKGISFEKVSEGLQEHIIENNFIEMETVNGSNGARGININNPLIYNFPSNPIAPITNTYMNILGNRIIVNKSGSVGIYGLNANYVLIENDTIELNNKTVAYGVNLQYCNPASVVNNRVIYTFQGNNGGQNANMTAFRFWDCNNASLIECNTTASTRQDGVGTSVGYGFGGNSNTSALFKGNIITKHSIGLMHSSGFIGSQYNHGNQWLGDYTNGVPAFGNVNSYTFFNFTVLPNLPFDPNGFVNGTFGPGVDPTLWFDSEPLPYTEYCVDNQQAGADELGLLSNMEELLVETDPALPQYSESVNWTADQLVYQKLDALVDSVELAPLEAAFYEAKAEEPMGQLVQVSKDIQKAIQPNPQDSALLVSGAEEAKDIKELIKSPEYQLENALNGNDSLLIFAARDSLFHALAATATSLDSLSEQVKAENVQEFNEVSAQNEDINVIDVFEANQRTVNDIYLATVARGLYALTQGQIDTLYGIAMQCPLSGGIGVYGARYLYEALVGLLIIDDDENCAANFIQQRTVALPDSARVNITVYPNPSTGVVFVAFDEPLEDACRLILTNPLGVVVFESMIQGNLLSKFVVLKDVLAGVYGLQVIDNQGKLLYSDKLIIIP